MSKKIQAIRGMNDLLPKDSNLWLAMEGVINKLLITYGYKNIRTPIVEKTETFTRAIGAVTDIVEKEMYTWQDLGGDSLTLRPEGTAGCVRMMIEHNLPREGIQKVFYQGPMFRHERPQKGRYRQFHQVGVEIFGATDAKIDAELIAMTLQLWQRLGLNNVSLEVNSLGSNETREEYRKLLYGYFSKHKSELDEDSVRRLESNPLRILDSKNTDMAELIASAPKMIDHLDVASAKHFEEFTSYLDCLNINYTVNPRLVRGLDYYNRTVFEWISNDLGSQGTICAGGRYDGLVEQMGGKPTPGVGFAMGLERLMLLISEQSESLTQQRPSLYFVALGDEAQKTSMRICNGIHQTLPEVIVINDITMGSLKSQMKKADKSNSDFALILGEEEISNNQISIKPLKGQGEQQLISLEGIIAHLQEIL
ncbi:MAG: histidine--tRNA ligase [Gammaproteobacteria bacterium]|nr:histidine--tRNA ligase [Gammaproteobacteria bacterium]